MIKRQKILRFIAYGGLAYFSYLMLLITLQYFPIDFHAAFLVIKEEEIKLPYYQVAFFTHVYTSIFTMLLGFTQFSGTLRSKYSALHRNFGKLYIVLIVLFAGPSGLIMGYHANGGFYSQLAFCSLAILWIYFTFQAYRFALKTDWKKHQNFIYRSYALTLSAVSLRLFKWIIVGIWELPPMDTYRIVAWLGWLINLTLAELLIRLKKFN